MDAAGAAFTVTVPVVAEQPAGLVNVNVAEPFDKPVTTPLLFTLATVGLLLTHVPPAEGLNVVVSPTQMEAGPVMATVGVHLHSLCLRMRPV